MRTKLHATTLIELIVALLLGALLVALGYGALSFVRQKFFLTQEHRGVALNSDLLHTSLASDFHHADHILVEEGKLRIYLDTQLVNWKFEEEFVVRAIEKPDTFWIGVSNLDVQSNLISGQLGEDIKLSWTDSAGGFERRFFLQHSNVTEIRLAPLNSSKSWD